MIRNYFKIAWRNALKNKIFTGITLLSLTLGISLFFIISIWVQDELSYDKSFKDAGDIFRLESNLTLQDGNKSSMQTVGWPVGKTIIEHYPEVESLTYMRSWSPVINFKNTKYYEDALMADNNFFSVFGYELEEGNKEEALVEPYSVVITPALKEKFFGSNRAVGEILTLSDSIPYKVTGVLKNLTGPTHLKFDILGSFSTLCATSPDYCKNEFVSGWFDVNVYNYMRLNKNANESAIASKIGNLVKEYGKEAIAKTGFKTDLVLRPVEDIYLKSGMPTGLGTTGNIKSVRLFFAIGIFILLLACLNFINLTTASSMERATEIGIKKVLGSNRKRLIQQFLSEAALLCIIASIFSVLLIVFCIPYFNQFTGKSFAIQDIFEWKRLVLFFSIILILIPLAGFYPAWIISSFKPIKVLKGQFSHSISGNLFRKGLVVFQFVVSVAFIMISIVMNKQMKYMQQESLGFDNDKILLLDMDKVPWQLRHNKADVFKNVLLNKKGISKVSASNAIPGRTGWAGQFAYPEGRSKNEGLIVEYIPVDFDYIETLGLKLAAGRNFLNNSEADTKDALLINEASVKSFGWMSNEDAIGKKLATSGKEGTVVGVLKDYHQHGLQDKINPVVLGLSPYFRLFAVRYENIEPKEAVSSITSAWKDVFKDYPMEYHFMDEVFGKQYTKEKKLETFVELATILSIIIACMGLLGLSIYTAQKRVKEIGIRKVLGASTLNIVNLLSKEFLKLVALAIIIAIPIAWISMNKWLQDFAYHTTLSWWIFIVAGVLTLAVAFIAMAYQSIKTALSNPSKSLRTE